VLTTGEAFAGRSSRYNVKRKYIPQTSTLPSIAAVPADIDDFAV
jgi:hypothetical protein